MAKAGNIANQGHKIRISESEHVWSLDTGDASLAKAADKSSIQRGVARWYVCILKGEAKPIYLSGFVVLPTFEKLSNDVNSVPLLILSLLRHQPMSSSTPAYDSNLGTDICKPDESKSTSHPQRNPDWENGGGSRSIVSVRVDYLSIRWNVSST